MMPPANRKEIELVLLEEDGPRFLTTSRIIHHLYHTPLIRRKLAGEALFRLWLCPHGDFRESLTTALTRTSGIGPFPALTGRGFSHKDGDRTEWPDEFKGASPETAAYLDRHLGYTKICDGIIPVLIREEEAIPIPFQVEPAKDVRGEVFDVKHEPVPGWSRHLPQIEDFLGHGIRLRLLVATGSRATDLEGASFGVPVVLAHAIKRGLVSKCQPLRVVATGKIHADLTLTVEGLELKRQLAMAMGAEFIAPGNGEGLNDKLTRDELLDEMEKVLSRRGTSRPKPLAVAGQLRKLKNDLHAGSVGLDEAAGAVGRLLGNVADDDQSAAAVEARIWGQHILASCANHRGESEKALEHLRHADRLFARCKDPALNLHIQAATVVALTDFWELDEALMLAKRLFDHVKSGFIAGAEGLAEAEMVASGVLGGQPLLQLALQGRADPEESRAMLEINCEKAQELGRPSEICRGTTQRALWSALFEPENFAPMHKRAAAILDQHLPDSQKSRSYLDNYRLLAARRRVLFGDGIIEEGFERWPIPAGNDEEWLRATALKYRGTIYLSAGRRELSVRDYTRALNLLTDARSPLLQFIRLTTAAEWLLGDPSDCERGFDQLIRELKNCPHKQARLWAESLRRSPTTESLRLLIRNCRY